MDFEIIFEATNDNTGKEIIYYKNRRKDKIISPWHNINYRYNHNYTFIVEIPKLTTKKVEMNKNLKYKVLTQELQNGRERYYHGPIYLNYGFISQTWESPYHSFKAMKF